MLSFVVTLLLSINALARSIKGPDASNTAVWVSTLVCILAALFKNDSEDVLTGVSQFGASVGLSTTASLMYAIFGSVYFTSVCYWIGLEEILSSLPSKKQQRAFARDFLPWLLPSRLTILPSPHQSTNLLAEHTSLPSVLHFAILIQSKLALAARLRRRVTPPSILITSHEGENPGKLWNPVTDEVTMLTEGDSHSNFSSSSKGVEPCSFGPLEISVHAMAEFDAAAAEKRLGAFKKRLAQRILDRGDPIEIVILK